MLPIAGCIDPALRLLLLVVIFFIALPSVYRRLKKERDPEWELRWGELPLGEGRRLIQQAQPSETSTRPGLDARLARSEDPNADSELERYRP